MSAIQLIALLPFEILGAAAILSLLASAFIRKVEAAYAVTLIGLGAALAAVWFVWLLAPVRAGGFLVLDHFALFTTALSIGATIITAMASLGRLRGRDDERGEYFFLLILSCLGASVLAAAGSFAAFFLGLELLSVTLFPLIAYRRERQEAASAGIMYMILAGVSSAFLLLGMALMYAGLGTMSLSEIALRAASGQGGILVLSGLGLMVVGVGFKLAVVPFHFWTPDIYGGTSSPVAGFIATVSKGAMAVLLVRFLGPVGAGALGAFIWLFPVISALTMFAGNLLALRENNVKRILAYSSIAHLGYLLIAFVAGGEQAVTATAFFLAAYLASTLGAFTAVEAASSREHEADMIEDYRGLGRRAPWLAGGLTISLLSLAGLPLTAGFMGKFVLFAAGGTALQWTLMVLLALNSTISLFYYLKVVSAMYRAPVEALEGAVEAGGAVGTAAAAGIAGGAVQGGTGAAAAVPGTAGAAVAAPIALYVPFFTGLALALALIAIIVLGIYPTPLMSLIETFVR